MGMQKNLNSYLYAIVFRFKREKERENAQKWGSREKDQHTKKREI